MSDILGIRDGAPADWPALAALYPAALGKCTIRPSSPGFAAHLSLPCTSSIERLVMPTMTAENVPSERNARTGKLTPPSVLARLRGLVSTLKLGGLSRPRLAWIKADGAGRR